MTKYFDEVNDDKVKEAINNISLFKTSRSSIDEFKPTLTKDIFKDALEAYDYKYTNDFHIIDLMEFANDIVGILKEN